jgi:hypothetical protein
MARVALLTLSDDRDVVARGVAEFRPQAADAVTAGLIDAGHGLVRVSQPGSANDVATQDGRPPAASQRPTIPACPVRAGSATGAVTDGPLTMQLLRLLADGLSVPLGDARHCDADRDARGVRSLGQHMLNLPQAPRRCRAGPAKARSTCLSARRHTEAAGTFRLLCLPLRPNCTIR